MESMVERAQRSPFVSDQGPAHAKPRTVPIRDPPPVLHSPVLPVPTPGDPMEITTTSPSTTMMAPPARTSPESEANGGHDQHMAMGDQPSTGSLAGPNAAAAAAAAGAQQPKVVQTAFIHKLYK